MVELEREQQEDRELHAMRNLSSKRRRQAGEAAADGGAPGVATAAVKDEPHAAPAQPRPDSADSKKQRPKKDRPAQAPAVKGLPAASASIGALLMLRISIAMQWD